METRRVLEETYFQIVDQNCHALVEDNLFIRFASRALDLRLLRFL